MNKLIVFFLIVFCLTSCKKEFNVENHDVTNIEVYHTPFDLLFPTQLNEDSARKIRSFQINDSLEIKSIINEIRSLSKIKPREEFNKNQIYLICDFYTNENKSFTLMFDKNFISLNGETYNNNERLIDVLIKK